MSKSHRELTNKKSNYNTIYLFGHNRTHSKKFINPIAIEPLLAKGKSYYKSNQLTDALRCFQEIINHADKFVEEAWYLAGLILIAQQKHAKSLKYLLEISKKVGNYKNNTYLFISICYNAIGQSSPALEYIDKLCSEQNATTDAYFYRGKLHYKSGNYDKAAQDFKKAIDTGNKQNKVKIFYCQALQRCHKIEQVKILVGQILSEIENKPKKVVNKKFMKRIYNIQICLKLVDNKIAEAQQICSKSLEISPDSQTLFHKAKIHQLKNQKDQIILAFNQCLNYSTNNQFIVTALQELIVIAMEERDFYEAFQYTKRITFLKIESKKLLQLSRLAEGVTFLMKKKYGEALLLFGSINKQSLAKSKFQLSYSKTFESIIMKKEQNLLNLYNNSMGYAYFCLGEFANALKKYRCIQKHQNCEEHMLYFYNISLCEGIELYENQKVEEAIKKFEESTEYLLRPQPYFYIAVILVKKHLSDHVDSDFFMKIIEIIDTGIKVGENSQMYYYRAMIYLYLGMNAQSIDDIDKAIEKSEDNVAKYFFLRALIFFQQKNYEQAITEFSTSLSIDQNLYDAYLERAKARLLNEQIEEAFEDLRLHPMHDDWKPLFQLHLGNYEEIVEEGIAEKRIIQNAEFMLGKFSEGGPAGKIMLALICENYSEVSDLLDDALTINMHVGCLQVDDLYTIKAYCCHKSNKHGQAIQNLLKAEQILRKSSNISYCQQQQKKLLAIKVNIILQTLIDNQIEKSLQLCQTLINDVYEGVIYDELTKLKKMIDKINQNQELSKNQGSENSDYDNFIMLFNGEHMLSNYMPIENYKGIKYKFLVAFPKTKILDIEIAPYEAPLISFELSHIDNRPEAPWMRRDENGVIFTSQIYKFDNLNLETEQNQLENSEKNKIKQELQLDPEVIKKLQKLNKSKQQA